MNIQPYEQRTSWIGVVVVQWIRPGALNREMPGPNLLAAAIVPLGKAIHPHKMTKLITSD